MFFILELWPKMCFVKSQWPLTFDNSSLSLSGRLEEIPSRRSWAMRYISIMVQRDVQTKLKHDAFGRPGRNQHCSSWISGWTIGRSLLSSTQEQTFFQQKITFHKVEVKSLKISASLSLPALTAISGTFRCVFRSHFQESAAYYFSRECRHRHS